MPIRSARPADLRIIGVIAQFAGLVALTATLSADNSPTTGTNINADAHWSLKSVVRPATPPLTGPERNPIDAFIAARLAKERLTPSPEADRRTLIRRLSFDLTGLPPSPEEVAAFEQSRDPRAFERLVDRLLDSPHYGERWARHWLDAVRYAETHGFEMNQPRPNAWPYRDYVIRAFNEDKPYDRFVMEQLAGDALGVDEATGFLVAGPWDQVKSPDPILTANQRADELHDMVSTTGSAFLGLTVGCARCHNHKFDPIPQTDYYALKACLSGVEHGEREIHDSKSEERARIIEGNLHRLAEIERGLEEFEPIAQSQSIDTNRLRNAVNARLNVERIMPVAARRLRFTVTRTTDAEPCIDELEIYTPEPGRTNIALASAGTKARASGVYPNSSLHKLEHINDGRHGNSHSWISDEKGKGWVELEFPQTVTIDRILWSRDRERAFSDRLPVEYRIEIAADANDLKLVASSADRQPYDSAAKSTPAALAHLDSDQQERVKQLKTERATLDARLKELKSAGLIYAGRFSDPPAPIRRLSRGDPMQEREPVPPGVLSALPNHSDLPDNADEKSRRLALANWIADSTNPLTARVLVNRLWQHHFGEGLVRTPSDFGVNGARPTHPELLEWLASEFMDHGWSIKHIHRLILNSAAYRQSSAVRSEAVAVDAETLLLWRFPPRRLEAEVIRDSILAVSGTLDTRMGGPGFSFFEPNDNYVRVYEPRKQFTVEEWRRMIYGIVVRQRPDGVFGVFDCPDGGQIAPKRTQSTTPLQALNLLNSGFISQQSEFFARRLRKETGENAASVADRAFALAFQRPPDREELAAATALIRDQGIAVFCRAIFNANELVYVF